MTYSFKKFLSSGLISGLLATGLVLTSCTPYQQQVQQGNIITQGMMDKIKPEMTKQQVAYVLGTPNIKNPFDQSQWIYFYSNKEDGKTLVQNHLVLDFVNNKLSHISGTYAPPAELQYTSYQTN